MPRKRRLPKPARPTNHLPRILVTLFLALTVSAILAPLAAYGVSIGITHNPCPFGTVPRLLADPSNPNSSTSLMGCMDGAGRLHSMDKMLLVTWLTYLIPVSILLFFLIYRSGWIHKLSVHN
jgi:hypothetical protein